MIIETEEDVNNPEAFGEEVLRAAAEKGVNVKCVTCKVLPDQMDIYDFAEVRI